MKYGDQLEHESVPKWSLHNLDYNSLKHEIKAHTTRAQASAMAIPGTEDTALRKFEDGLYLELSRQHDRVHLFVMSKADEITRRLDALSRAIDRWIAKSAHDSTISDILRRQRRFVRHERDLIHVGDDIQALIRFANAQIVAFRKIIKKYKKWTGSTTLGARFTQNVLGDPKSFTRRDFNALQVRQQDILTTLRDANPQLNSDDPSTASSDHPDEAPSTANNFHYRHVAWDDYNPRQTTQQIKYWNEYDDGSEAGGPVGDGPDNDDYAIYIDPDADSGLIPGFSYVQNLLTSVRQWFRSAYHLAGEREPLLAGARRPASSSSDDDDDDSQASDDLPTLDGYTTHYAFPSVSDQKITRYRERVLFWTTLGCFAATFVLLAVAAVLLTTARHKMRVEVDAVVTVAVALSLLCACSALAATLHRAQPPSLSYRVMIWSTFTAACLLNGMMLIVVAGNPP